MGSIGGWGALGGGEHWGVGSIGGWGSIGAGGEHWGLGGEHWGVGSIGGWGAFGGWGALGVASIWGAGSVRGDGEHWGCVGRGRCMGEGGWRGEWEGGVEGCVHEGGWCNTHACYMHMKSLKWLFYWRFMFQLSLSICRDRADTQYNYAKIPQDSQCHEKPLRKYHKFVKPP